MYKVGRLRLNQGRKLCNPSKENPFLLCAVSGVIDHEGGNVVTPRVEFHFIDRYTDVQYQEGVTSDTPSAPYNFVNTAGNYQTAQILKDGEALELITDPANVSFKDNDGNGVEKFFYGWYVVDMSADTSKYDAETGKYSGTITFTWPENPEQIAIEKEISIAPTSGLSIGSEITWTLNGVTGTGILDENGTVHVYLAPLYEDFHFINFHKGPKEDTTGLATNLMTRKLVVFGSGDTALVRIGNVVCEGPDPNHQIFTGWETVKKENGSLVSETYYHTVTQHPDTASGSPVYEEVNNQTDTEGYYVEVSKGDSSDVDVLDLYPVFDEARWLFFNRGLTGNGSTYVGAAYRLTNDSAPETITEYYYFDEDFFKAHLSARKGYTFGGWYLFANMDDNREDATSEILNLNDRQDVVVDYFNATGEAKTATINTMAIQLVDSEGNIVASDGTWYVHEDTNTISQVAINGTKLFKVENKKLYFYTALNDMTLAAKWVKEDTIPIRVIVWKQKVTDDKDTTKTPVDLLNWLKEDPNRVAKNYPYTVKDYDYEIFYTANVSSAGTPDLTNFDGTYVDADGNTQTAPRNLLNQSFTGFHYSADDVSVVGVPNPDGTTVYNVYYDRDLLTMTFNTYTNDYTYTETTSANGTQYGLVNGQYVQLTRGGGKQLGRLQNIF